MPVSKEIPPISSKIEIAELCFSWLKYFWAKGRNFRHTIVRRCNRNKADDLGFWIMWSNNQRIFFSWNGRGFFGSRFLLSNLMMIFYLQWTVHSLHDAKTYGDEWMKCDFLVIFFFSFRLVVGVMCVLVTKFTGCPAFSTSFGCWNTLYDF